MPANALFILHALPARSHCSAAQSLRSPPETPPAGERCGGAWHERFVHHIGDPDAAVQIVPGETTLTVDAKLQASATAVAGPAPPARSVPSSAGAARHRAAPARPGPSVSAYQNRHLHIPPSQTPCVNLRDHTRHIISLSINRLYKMVAIWGQPAPIHRSLIFHPFGDYGSKEIFIRYDS